MASPLALAPLRAPRPTAERAAPRSRGDDVETLLGIGVTIEVAAGQTIVLEGDPLRHCFRIVDGAVRLFKAMADGRRQVIDFLAAGDSFGLVGKDSFACSAEAMVPTTLIRHPRGPLQRDVVPGSSPPSALYTIACDELARMQRQMLLLGRKSAEEKIATFLLAEAERAGRCVEDGLVFPLPMSRQDMADYLGLTIETVSRTFSRLKRRGLIELPTPQQVVLRRCGALLALADGIA